MDKIFKFVLTNNLKATFFIVGWIAQKYPELVKRIDQLGFEIGSHSHMHQLMYELTPQQVDEDLKRSVQTLENITGKKVKSFRAPGFSITKTNKWAFEILIKNGIKYDSSIFPSNRSHGGFPDFSESKPSTLIINGLELKEFPINTNSFFGHKWIFSGGGYFRLFPYKLIHDWTKKADYVMTYFHPRDFDVSQPLIKELSLFRRFKSYYGLKSSMPKLNQWVNDFEFIDLKAAYEKINWDKAPRINLD